MHPSAPRRIAAAAGLALLVAAGAATAQPLSDVDPAHKHAWGENVGFFNWRDAGSPVASQGVRVHATVLSGFVWGENIGWINLGDGAPASPPWYSVTDGPDTGVNIAPDDKLFGFAWGENVGWINFDGGLLASPPQPARIDRAANRLRGYAWGENIGWINLDHPVHYVGLTPACRADFDGSGAVGVPDIFAFLSSWFAAETRADFDGQNGVGVPDIFAFLSAWFAGC